jgi:hypothetical protein
LRHRAGPLATLQPHHQPARDTRRRIWNAGQRAIAQARPRPDREASALNQWGRLHKVRGDVTQAEEFHQQAPELARAITSFYDEAHALADPNRCAMTGGHITQPEALLRLALEIFQRIGAAEAPALLAGLNQLTSQGPQGKAIARWYAYEHCQDRPRTRNNFRNGR